MARDTRTILKLRVPVIVRIGDRRMSLDDVLALSPGAIIELPRPAERPLDLMVNNKVIGVGEAVKVGENFGLKVIEVGDAPARVRALAGKAKAAKAAKTEAEAEADAEGEAEAGEGPAAEAETETEGETPQPSGAEAGEEGAAAKGR